jgi:hypothetical protein
MTTARSEVFKDIDLERMYQDSRRNARSHPIEAWILYMEYNLSEAKKLLFSERGAIIPALHIIRKVTTMGVACMEEHGVEEKKLVCYPTIRKYLKRRGLDNDLGPVYRT